MADYWCSGLIFISKVFAFWHNDNNNNKWKDRSKFWKQTSRFIGRIIYMVANMSTFFPNKLNFVSVKLWEFILVMLNIFVQIYISRSARPRVQLVFVSRRCRCTSTLPTNASHCHATVFQEPSSPRRLRMRTSILLQAQHSGWREWEKEKDAGDPRPCSGFDG